MKQFYSSQKNEWKQKPILRGKYIVETRGCVDCHSTFDEKGKLNESLNLAGGQKWNLGPYGDFYPKNLTPDKETGLGNWTYEEFKNAFTHGIKKDGTRMMPFPMPWTAYVGYTEEDIKSVYAYLQSLPPVQNKIPENKPLGFFSYMSAKFKMLILKEPLVAKISLQNFGSAQSQTSNGKEN